MYGEVYGKSSAHFSELAPYEEKKDDDDNDSKNI